MNHEYFMGEALALAREENSGCCGSVLNLFEERFNCRPRIYQGPLTAECEGVLQAFFQSLR